MLLAMDREVGPFWKVLPQQAVGIFIAASLPGASRITEVDVDAGSDAELMVPGHFFSAIPSPS